MFLEHNNFYLQYILNAYIMLAKIKKKMCQIIQNS